MKKRLAVLGTTLCLLLTGCGETVVNEYGNEVAKFGPYIEISHTETEDRFGNVYTFFIVYREDSKIVYEIADGGGYEGVSIQELHSYDEDGHPVLQFYEDGKIVTK